MRYCSLKIFDSKNKSYSSSLDKVLYKVKKSVKGSSNKGSQWGLVSVSDIQVSEKDCTFFKNFIYQKLGNKSKFFSTLQRFNMGALCDTADI